MAFWFQAPVLQFFPSCVGKILECKIISPETIILLWGHRKERYRDEFFLLLKKQSLLWATIPIPCCSMNLLFFFFFFGNSFLILQKSGLTTEKIVQRKEISSWWGIMLSRDAIIYCVTRFYLPFSFLWVYPIHTYILEVIGLRVWQWRAEKDDFTSNHSR